MPFQMALVKKEILTASLTMKLSKCFIYQNRRITVKYNCIVYIPLA